jgi:hypothetical protein
VTTSAAKRRCKATTKNGRRCRAWAVRGTDPPRCSAHRPIVLKKAPETGDEEGGDGFYERTYTLEELTDLVKGAMDHSLDDELTAARVALRRVMERLHDEMPADPFARLVGLVFKGAETVVRLLQAQHVLDDLTSDMDIEL